MNCTTIFFRLAFKQSWCASKESISDHLHYCAQKTSRAETQCLKINQKVSFHNIFHQNSTSESKSHKMEQFCLSEDWNETFWMVFKQCAKEDRGGPLSWTILFLCFFSIVSDVMRCIPRVLEQNPKIGCFRSISRVSWNLLTLEREVEQRNLIFGVCFFKEKDILEFPLEKRCKRKKEECRTKDHRASSSHLCF